jgi:hypothetical protein
MGKRGQPHPFAQISVLAQRLLVRDWSAAGKRGQPNPFARIPLLAQCLLMRDCQCNRQARAAQPVCADSIVGATPSRTGLAAQRVSEGSPHPTLRGFRCRRNAFSCGEVSCERGDLRKGVPRGGVCYAPVGCPAQAGFGRIGIVRVSAVERNGIGGVRRNCCSSSSHGA